MDEKLLQEIIDQIKDLNLEMRNCFADLEGILKSIDKKLGDIKKEIGR